MGRSAKLRAARRLEKANPKPVPTTAQARHQASLVFYEFLEAARQETTPGVTFFDPKGPQMHFLPLAENTAPDLATKLEGIDWEQERVVAILMQDLWQVKSFSLPELGEQMEALRLSIAQSEAKVLAESDNKKDATDLALTSS